MIEPKTLATVGVYCLKEAVLQELSRERLSTVVEVSKKLDLPLHECSCKRIVKAVLHQLESEGKAERDGPQKWGLNQ
ncbi:MAG: hypothetical protein OXG10_08070 [Candidatus Dadabacteria bacterium]|nr:hypothetical protein [Candidatus Dadabacteria bacterium]